MRQSVRKQFPRRRQHFRFVRERVRFERRRIGRRDVECGDALDRRVEIVKSFFGDARGELRAGAAGERCSMKSTGSSSRMAAFSKPFASYAVPGATIFSPGRFMNIASGLSE